jgi:twitching motility protein PilT
MITKDEIFRFMMEKEAYEIHVVPGSPLTYRDKKGALHPVDANTITPADTKKFVADALTDEQKAEFTEKMQIMTAVSVPGLSRYRINIFMQRNTISAIITTIPPSPPTIEELNLPPIVKQIADRATKGLIVICGMRGSGKAHTLAAMINHILETRTCKIVSLESPIRFLFKNKKGIIVQREMGIDMKNYSEAFRQLPLLGADIIVLNEIESFEVAQGVLSLASGGALVFLTAISPCVMMMMDKILDLYPENLKTQCKNLMSVGMEAVIAQSLLKKANEEGVLPAQEIMLATPQVRIMLKDAKFFQIQGVMQTTGRELGMISQEQAFRSLVKKNLVTQDEAYAKAIRPEEFRKVMALPF